MSRLLPLQGEPTATEEGFRSLIDEIPVGLVWLTGGQATAWNASAAVLLESAHGPRLEALITRLVEASASTQACIHATHELSGAERVKVAVAPDRSPGRGDTGRSFLVTLDRQRAEKARAEASVLRAVLKAIGTSSDRRQALQRSLEAVHGALVAMHLAFFELSTDERSWSCTALSGLSERELDPEVLRAKDSLIAVAQAGERPLTLADASHAQGLPFSVPPGVGVVLLPVRGRSARGVLTVATREGLSDSLLRLCLALADAIGAVLDLASLENEAARAREVATQRDRLATIGQLVAGVAHEINNPLAFLKSNLNSLRVDLDDWRGGKAGPFTDEADEIVAESLEGVSRIETIVQALKSTSRKKDERVRFDPGRAVAEAITIFRGAHKQDCDLDCAGLTQLPEVMGSPSALGQVTLNLLQNGLDAMGSLERRRRKLVVSSRVDASAIHLSFRDHGTGIPLEVQKKMFDAFFTTKDPGKGTGLGLAICKEIVEQMGGAITFVTGSDGTCFELKLPVDAAG